MLLLGLSGFESLFWGTFVRRFEYSIVEVLGVLILHSSSGLGLVVTCSWNCVYRYRLLVPRPCA